MIAGGLAVFAVLIAGVLTVGLLLAHRAVTSTAHTKPIQVAFGSTDVSLPATAKTVAAGEYLLRLSGKPGAVVHVGNVLSVTGGTVRRALTGGSGACSGRTEGYWSAHRYASPSEVAAYETIQVPLSGGGARSAWLFPGDPERWVIHVQGVRTSREVTLRTVALAHMAGSTSLAITYRGAGDGPPSRATTLGAEEWAELRDAIAYARKQGAVRVTVAAWSMGAALVFELLRHSPDAFDDAVLLCPVSSWPATLEYGAAKAHLPRPLATLAGALLRSRACARILGMPIPVDIRKLEWTYPGSLPIRTLIIHSQGDEVVPWASTTALVSANPDTATLIQTTACPHGFELTVPDPNACSRIVDWLIN